MARNFRKDGVGRAFESIAKSVRGTTGRGSITTGLIESGAIVTVDFKSGTEHTKTLKARRTGAIPISINLPTIGELHWRIEDNVLICTQNGLGSVGSVTFWVF